MSGLLSVTPRVIGVNLLKRDHFLVEEGNYPFWNAFLVTEGSFFYESAGETIQAGELALFASGEPYRRQVISPITFFGLHIEWDLSREEQDRVLPRGKLTFRNPKRVLSTAALMKKAIEEPSSLAFCDHFFKDIWLQYCLENKDESPALPPILNDAIQRIHQCLPRALSVAELARDLHVSHVYLIQLFKKHLNVTPTDYVIGFRLEQAKLLLSDTDEPISTLAERCGFSNAYYFSTLFKKKTGLSPGVYRKMYRV